MTDTEEGARREDFIRRKSRLAVYEGEDTLDITVHGILLVDATYHAARSDREIRFSYACKSSQDWYGQEMIGIKGGRRITRKAEDGNDLPVGTAKITAIGRRARPHGDAVVELRRAEGSVDVGHRVKEADGDAASADNQVRIGRKGSDGGFFVGEDVWRVGDVVVRDRDRTFFLEKVLEHDAVGVIYLSF